MARDIMSFDCKARELVAKMSLNEKLTLMRGTLSPSDIVATAKGGYNKYQGTYCCSSDYLINKVLRGRGSSDRGIPVLSVLYISQRDDGFSGFALKRIMQQPGPEPSIAA